MTKLTILVAAVLLSGCAMARDGASISTTQGQTTQRVDSQGWITNTRGQTVGRIDSQGYITNTRGQTIGRIEGTRR